VEAIVLAGGLGTRLRTVTGDLPKPLAPVRGRPFLDYALNHLRRYGVSRVVLATSYRHEMFAARYGQSFLGMKIDYSIEETPLGTGGAIRQAMRQTTSKSVFALNGDTLFELDLVALAQLHAQTNSDLTLGLKAMQNISRYGTVNFSGDKVVGFEEKKRGQNGTINGGVYLVRADLFKAFDLPATFSFEEDFLKPRVAELNVRCLLSQAYFIDIGVPEDYERAQKDLKWHGNLPEGSNPGNC